MRSRVTGFARHLALVGAVLACNVNLGEGFPRPGEWVGPRGNASLDGHAKSRGGIRSPDIVWRHRIGATVTRVAVLPHEGDTSRTIPEPVRTDGQQKKLKELGAKSNPAHWFDPPPSGHIEGSVQAINLTGTSTYADVLPEVPGLEKFEFASGFNIPTKDGKWQYGPGRLLAWRSGGWQTVWETEPIDHSFRPYPLAADFDADGRLEVAVLPWRALHIYDAASGELEQRCEFTTGRSYGFFGVYDFDDDGQSEFLVMADFSKHIDVLGYRDGQLVVLWQWEIEVDISNPQKIMRVLPEPVVDLNGDRQPEVLVNLYNDSSDRRWHLLVFDSMTGELKADVPDEIAQGTADLDGDGLAEVLTASTSGQHVPPFGMIRVRQLSAGGLVAVWENGDAAWQCAETPLELHRHNEAQFSRFGVLARNVDGRDIVVVRRRGTIDPTTVEITTAHWDGTGLGGNTEPVLAPTLIARHAEVLALDAEGVMLAEIRSPAGSQMPIAARRGRLAILDTKAAEMRLVTPPAVARIEHRRASLVVVHDTSLLSWVVIEPPTQHQPSRELWRLVDGEDMASVSPSRNGPVIADLQADGRRQLLVAAASHTGCAQLVAVDLESGDSLWQHEFERFSAGHYLWNFGGPLLWQAGFFTDPHRQDVLITLQRTRMHSEETHVLSGRDGKRVWHRDRQIADRGFGGQLFAIADFDGNGLEDAASFYTHIRYIVDGASGKDLLAEENYWSEVPVRPVYWGQPVAGAFDIEQESPSLLFTTTGNQMVGRLRSDGSLVWSDAYDQAANGFPAVGDFDADGEQEAIYIGFRDGTRCYDVNSGNREWTLDLGAGQHVASAVSGDVDGDGRDEAVFTIGTTLYCVEVAEGMTAGRVAWKLALPTVVSSPILATVDGDRLSILVTGQDGYLYCVDDRDNRIGAPP